MTIPLPRNEIERLNALHALQILDTPPEEHFDAVARLAQRAFDIPVALVSMLDADRQWFKARCGIDFESTARELAFCNYTILSEEPLIVEDATRDPRFAANPFVTGEPGIRFYAGAPLVLEPGICVGTLCVVAVKPRQFTDEQRKTLRDLARTVVAHLRLHEARAEVERRENQLREQTCLLEATLDHMDQGLIMIDGNDRVRVHTLEVLVVQIMPSAGLGKPTTSS
jgi:GAF domain-containing protein